MFNSSVAHEPDMALANGIVRATVIFESSCDISRPTAADLLGVQGRLARSVRPSGSGPLADLSSHRGLRLGTYWARNAKGLRE